MFGQCRQEAGERRGGSRITRFSIKFTKLSLIFAISPKLRSRSYLVNRVCVNVAGCEESRHGGSVGVGRCYAIGSRN